MTDRAKIFSHGGSQAVRLPKAYRFEGAEVLIRKEGDKVILEPCPAPVKDWTAFWDELDRLRGDYQFVEPEDPPAESVDVFASVAGRS